ncbi:uncharacterized protein [Battus philenor]|uniref:uncharacterized protein n=1 Tax=Battus philenor TaxID=42288 RepID=UPI0035CEFD6C
MKHQEVGVNYWSMAKAMLIYGALTAMAWLMLRLFNTVFTLPRRLRDQHENIQTTLKELQKRFPDLNITEEDLLNADKELEKLMKEDEEAGNETKENDVPTVDELPSEEEKKTV